MFVVNKVPFVYPLHQLLRFVLFANFLIDAFLYNKVEWSKF